ncbi:MAG: MoaD/ThiS family protein [Oscillospiraceae bacterium]|jgi:molybdopterin synthase sulfur carrier subunit|nr:MoaD/ThiS family protein [Oscillospiraceae bacterium]
MVEVRLFSGFRKGRNKITVLPVAEFPTVDHILRRMEIPAEEVSILLINGFHSQKDDPLKSGDVVSLFPAVGGG